MARVIFYGKPNCRNNIKQKTLLTAAGHEVISFNILIEPWTIERLYSFFDNLPVTEWFNKAAPRVQSGEVVPRIIDPQTALLLMIQDPLLIRRPLIEIDDRREAGFEIEKSDAWIGLRSTNDLLCEISKNLKDHDLQGCPHKQVDIQEKVDCKEE